MKTNKFALSAEYMAYKLWYIVPMSGQKYKHFRSDTAASKISNDAWLKHK